ncbi:bacillithiol biosynthesis cysteine-adding enzyme BshC [Bacillus alveayuensis]|uniref:bacillithiol biosynthesis cysteine-adding enzyme BshC n=1 Tax=Aeribacillus alveayuensis TaxID=279215 RepID=UPI0005D12DB8|nr:bacillithiol biosynthesis cysteine-adding enzyme BshC [Bacillus alveayuensis]
MEMVEISLPSVTPLATDYIKSLFPVNVGFDYDIYDHHVFKRRLNDLKERTFPRQKLVEHLLNYHEKFTVSEKTLDNIHRLLDPASVVVIGGQQAGLLTGPLYTIHKIISILTLAKQQEKVLNVPVVPVFWIAGEDHDIAEVNHVYVTENGKIQKKTYPYTFSEKRMVAELPIEKKRCFEWVKEIVETYGETDVTNQLLSFIEESLEETETFVDFFASLILRLFASGGLVVVNAADPQLRAIERDFFEQLLNRHHEITKLVLAHQEKLNELGYKKTLDVQPQSVHLFYHHDGERLLLEYDDQVHQFHSKKREVSFTYEELVSLVQTKPQLFSNNVVTRPLMQEYLFPTLAFIAGPGEIAYWAELKQAFSLFEFKMPPVVPRLNITIVERSVHTDIEEVGLTVPAVLQGGVEQAKENWLRHQHNYPLEELFANAKANIEEIHRPLREIGMEIDRGLADLLAKNAHFLQSQIDFLQQTLKRRLEQKYETELRKFARIEMALVPNQEPQERIWNVFYYMNKYGLDFVDRLLRLDYRWNGMHKIVYI